MITAKAPVPGYCENAYLPGTRSIIEYLKFVRRRYRAI